jgi:hypothetical protein
LSTEMHSPRCSTYSAVWVTMSAQWLKSRDFGALSTSCRGLQ